MAVTPSGMLSLPIKSMEDLIANTSAFQAWVGAGDVATARGSIYKMALPKPSDGDTYTTSEIAALWPFVIIAPNPTGGAFSADKVADADPVLLDRGSILVHWENAVATEDDDEPDPLYQFLNDVGGILNDMLNLSGTSTYLNVRSYNTLDGPNRATEDAHAGLGDYYYMVMQFDWGIV